MANKTRQQVPSILQSQNVFLFIPNVIGYTRIILAILSLYYMPFSPWTCMGLYTVSCLLDAVDGNAARYFDQCTKFGVVLDMVTDRSTTTCLLCFLSSAYPSWRIVFQLLISLDLSSHYMHMYSTLTAGASSHKKISESSNRMLRIYYSDNRVLFAVCAFNELFFVALYLLSFEGHSTFPQWSLYTLAFVSLPVCVSKQVINIIQLVGASQSLAKVDIEDRKKAVKKI
ncbi:CDP-alcohol phosphatidyltransferase-domain-containing protein [Gigaspora rosea]|uniref:CDP-diacylglycerol--inositol 3-phosphatidyltransferase n=1 Tax=Gigaspora rosea TaxID=44941 RepID=A0A397W972_9GLOM|nr:CDP-alcohol phosphatidyltransferase-domain-containing protein [Gigaspora rosea]